MKILVTGAKGFVGKNLAAALQNIRDGKDKTHPGLSIEEIYLYDIDSASDVLETACEKADFVFNLAGVNRPQNAEEFMQGNFGFASQLLETRFIVKVLFTLALEYHKAAGSLHL